MNKILILFAHPAYEKSRAHKVLLEHVSPIDGLYINDLYENYPLFDIDVPREQELLLTHDIIVWQHPLFWYSGPALLKQWIDLVLEHNWAYGSSGHALDGKKIFNTFTSGGGSGAYEPSGMQRCTITELFRPFERTAQLCRMIYLPPFWIPGTHRIESSKLHEYGQQYHDLLIAMRDDELPLGELPTVKCLNELSFNK